MPGIGTPALAGAGGGGGGGSVTQGTTPWIVDGSATTQPISAASLPLPSGAATEAKQDTGNTSLASIKTNTDKIPALGQALAAASVPVVLTAAQVTTLTPPSTVAVTQSTSPWVVNTGSPTGSAVPANAFYMGGILSGNLTGFAVVAPNGDAFGAGNNIGATAYNYVYNGSTWDRAKGNTTAPFVQGAVADAAAASGNPIAAGGIFETTPTTYTNGQRTTIHTDTRGSQKVVLYGKNTDTQIAEQDRNTINGLSTSILDLAVGARPNLYNGTNYDSGRSVINATNSTGTGIQAVGIVAQYDDTSPTAITENQFGNARMSSNRNLYGTIRDAAGNERGLNVDSNGEIGIGAIRSALPAGTNAIGKLSANSGVDIGDVDVTSIAAGTNNIGQVSVAPQTANGLSVFNGSSSDGATALTSTAQVIKASAGQVYGWYIYNPNATAQFVQFYNVAAASVTVGTTNPLLMLTVPPGSAANVEFTNGITFSNAGFSCAATSTAGGNGAPTTALDAVIFYK